MFQKLSGPSFSGLEFSGCAFSAPVSEHGRLKRVTTRMWANAQRDGRPSEYRWSPLFNVAKFG